MIAGVALGCHANHAIAMFRELPDVFFNAPELFEDARCALEHTAAGRRQDHPFADTQEERGVEPRLDVAELMTQRRLGQVQSHRRLRHAASFRDPGDQAQVPYFEIHD